MITAGTYTYGSAPVNLNGTGAITGPFAAFPGAIRPTRGLAITVNNPIVLQSDSLIHVQANVGTGNTASPVGSLTLAGAISGSARLSFTAPSSDVEQGVLTLNGANTYTGGTLVNGGIVEANGASATFGTGNVTVDHAASPNSIARLRIRSGVTNAIADDATLSLSGGRTGGVADEGWIILESGVNEAVGSLKLAGVVQTAGTYGSTSSAATFQNDEFFEGPGMLTVLGPITLTITLSGPNVVVSWPTNATGFQLQAAGAVTGTWTNDNTTIVVSGSNNTVTEAAVGTTKFYRLKK
jgi:autotransporter-associated beta strand protein